MKINLITFGDKPPKWVDDAVNTYQKRLPKQVQFTITALAIAKRQKNQSTESAKAKEAELLKAQLKPKDIIVALDAKGKILTSEALAHTLQTYTERSARICLLVGGPDGLSAEILQMADLRLSLSGLTLPHAMVRVMIAEALYRSVCILNNHPYHK